MRRSRIIEHGHTVVEARGIDRESEARHLLSSPKVSAPSIYPTSKCDSTENHYNLFYGSHVSIIVIYRLQIRFVLEFWCGKKDFPSKSDMLRDEAEELD